MSESAAHELNEDWVRELRVMPYKGEEVVLWLEQKRAVV
jgi:hypothetical protein